MQIQRIALQLSQRFIIAAYEFASYYFYGAYSYRRPAYGHCY
jgi:hypothetical protein